MIPIVYRWDDANAPVLNGTRGALINLLDKCLVTGYGSKTPAGWTKHFQNAGATIAYFRNHLGAGTGTGSYIRIDELTPAANLVYIQGFETVTDETTVIAPFLTVNNIGPSKSITADTTARMWVLIATNKCLYLFTYPGVLSTAATPPDFIGGSDTNYSEQQLTVFGDFLKTKEESFNCIIAYTWSRGYHLIDGFLSNFLVPGAAGLASMGCPRKIDGVLGASPVKMFTGHPGGAVSHSFENWPTGSGRTMGTPYVPATQLIIGRLPIIEDLTYTCRGHLPGFFIPCHDMDTMTNFSTITLGGRSFMCLKLCISNGGFKGKRAVLVDIGGEWE